MQQRRDQQVRKTILRAARQLLRERGLYGVGVNDAANRSGSSKATLYLWRRNKYELAVEAALLTFSPPSQLAMLDATSQTKAVIEQLFAWLSEPEVTAAAPLLVGAAPGASLLADTVRGSVRTSLIAIGSAHRRIWPGWYVDLAADIVLGAGLVAPIVGVRDEQQVEALAAMLVRGPGGRSFDVS